MSRVERRMYARRKKKRVRWILAALAVMALGGAWFLGRGGFSSEALPSPSPTPVARAYDTTPESREVTLPAETWYAIQTGVYSTREAADTRAKDYTARGAPGTVIQDGAKWRVFIACYGSEEDAASVRDRLGDRQQVDTYLFSWVCPELRLRLTGQAGQLDVAEAGFTLMTSTAAALRDAATLLDAGQLTTAEAAAKADALANQMALWAETARSRFGGRMPGLIQGMLAFTDGFPARAKAIRAAAASATDLSAALKGQAMSLFAEIILWRQGMQ